MMKKKLNLFKRSTALMVGVFLTASSLAGCAEKKPDTPSGTTSGSTSSGTQQSESEPSSAGSEPEIKWSGTISMAPYMFGSVENDVVTPLIEERLKDYGYDVTFENVYIENNQYAELMNLRIASDDAPDIIKIQDNTSFLQYAQQGVIATWDEAFFREHAPHVADFIDNGGPAASNVDIADTTWKMVAYEGKMAGIPFVSRNNGSLINVIYNKQWLEKLDAKVPETLDEFVDLMYRFKNEDPDGNGKNDTYGLSATMLNVIFGAYGSFPGFLHMDYGHWYDVGGSLAAADVMPGNKDALTLMKQLYDDGILDPEFVTGENQGGYWAISHPFVNGRIGVTHSASMNHYIPALEEGSNPGAVLAEFKAIQGEDSDVVIGPWLEGPNGDIGGFLRYSIQLAGGIVYNARLNKDTDKLAAIFEIMDIFNQDDELSMLAYKGIEGEHYTVQPEGYLMDIEGVDAVQKSAAGVGALRSLYGPELPFNEYLFTVNDNSPSAKWMADIKSEYKGLGNNVGYLSKVYTALPSESQYSGELQTYRDETWLGFIQGTVSLDDYDNYISEWNSRGGKVLTEEANEWYQSTNSK